MKNKVNNFYVHRIWRLLLSKFIYSIWYENNSKVIGRYIFWLKLFYGECKSHKDNSHVNDKEKIYTGNLSEYLDKRLNWSW